MARALRFNATMERRNVQLAFVGEGNSDEETNLDDLVEGDEAVDIEVTSGKVMLVVPAGTPDAEIFDKASILGGELVLENGLRLSFEIQQEATGAQFAATAKVEDDRPSGLSSLSDIPGGV
jgi:hypothetical protein